MQTVHQCYIGLLHEVSQPLAGGNEEVDLETGSCHRNHNLCSIEQPSVLQISFQNVHVHSTVVCQTLYTPAIPHPRILHGGILHQGIVFDLKFTSALVSTKGKIGLSFSVEAWLEGRCHAAAEKCTRHLIAYVLLCRGCGNLLTSCFHGAKTSIVVDTCISQDG
jgi:hypothetical protein